MTTLSELGNMLIAIEEDNRQMQIKDAVGRWSDIYLIDDFTLGDVTANEEYRLKPLTTYYRVWTFDGKLKIHSAKEQYPPFEDWAKDSLACATYVHDFEVEE